jgi:PAS domain S-box-containing protein
VLLAPLVAAINGTKIPGLVVPYLSLFSGLCLAVILWQLPRRDTVPGLILRESPDDILREIDVLNHHALVSITDSDSRLYHVNEKLLAATGYDPADLIGREASRFYHEADLPHFEDIRQGLSRGLSWSGETRLKCKNGDVMWTQTTVIPRLDRNGRLVGAISVRSDITEVKLAAEQKDLHLTLHTLRDEIYIFDAERLTPSYINAAAMERMGLDESHDPSAAFDGPRRALDLDTLRNRVAPLLSGHLDTVGYEETIGGTPFEIRVRLLESFTGNHKLIVMLRDISEQIETERAKAELLATISHELRTPMTSIKGAFGLLLSNAAGEIPEKARDMLSIGYRNADRLVMIINDILDIEKIAAGQMPFDMTVAPVSGVVNEAVAANEQFADRFDVTVSIDPREMDVEVEHDFGRTLQVLTNLLSNAAKFSPPGGRVVVSASQAGEVLRISVRDQGTGLSVEAQAKVFERFSQIAPSNNRGVAGTGLGLNIARTIMEKQGGSIGVDSKPGDGCTFYIEFPVGKSDSERVNRTMTLVK